MAPVLCKIVGAQVTLSFEMYPLYTVGEVRQEITSRTNVSRNHLTLRGSHYLERLDDHVTLEECGYRGEATIHLGVSSLTWESRFRPGGWAARQIIMAGNHTVMEDSYCLLDYLISKLGDVRVEINDGCKGVEESNSEGYSTTT
ncbi:hypothetical protein OIU77_017406 [Salix suchowensis]|uniref:Ubiquitin-like domain-containing protein n=1 Tax=Salix suchowensis TaxID=1278906 RepID=A0ABQ8ZP89_9ROSI|nr:hypothetical protein OIU77_017406 [Salix suchowensis]